MFKEREIELLSREIEDTRELSDSVAKKRLGELLNYPHSLIRAEAAEALGERCRGDAGVATELSMRLIVESDGLVQACLIEALGDIGVLASANEVVPWLDSEDVTLRMHAALALGSSGNASAIEPLERRLRVETASVVLLALVIALNRLGHQVPGSPEILSNIQTNSERDIALNLIENELPANAGILSHIVHLEDWLRLQRQDYCKVQVDRIIELLEKSGVLQRQ